MLLPRSTGLHYSLRSLLPRIPTLRMIDITMAYPGTHSVSEQEYRRFKLILPILGIPPLGYGQDYYTLRSIFFDGVAPPSIHVHIRMFDVAAEVPVGDLSQSNPEEIPEATQGERVIEVEIPEVEKDAFDSWLRELWREKDASMERYLQHGTFHCRVEKPLYIPLKLHRFREYFDAFCFFLPATMAYAWLRLRG
jgi:hypothetical protein